MKLMGVYVEIAKFVLTAIGTFISVSGLFFAVFQFWIKKREEKDAAFRNSVREELKTERDWFDLQAVVHFGDTAGTGRTERRF